MLAANPWQSTDFCLPIRVLFVFFVGVVVAAR
jgi:hypothetical protein